MSQQKSYQNVKKLYAVFEGNKILRISEDKGKLVKYRDSFPEYIRKNMLIAEKIIAGNKEYQQSHWMF